MIKMTLKLSLFFMIYAFIISFSRETYAACSYDISFGNEPLFTETATHPTLRGIPLPTNDDEAVNKYYVDQLDRTAGSLIDITDYTNEAGELVKLNVIRANFPLSNSAGDGLPSNLLFFHMRAGESFIGGYIPSHISNPSGVDAPDTSELRSYILETHFSEYNIFSEGRQYLYEIPSGMSQIDTADGRLADKIDNVGDYGGVFFRYRDGGAFARAWSPWYRIDNREIVSSDVYIDGSDEFWARASGGAGSQTRIFEPIPGIHLGAADNRITYINTNTFTITDFSTTQIGHNTSSPLLVQIQTAITPPNTDSQGGTLFSNNNEFSFSGGEIGFDMDGLNDIADITIGNLSISPNTSYTSKGITVPSATVRDSIISNNTLNIDSDTDVIRFYHDTLRTDDWLVSGNLFLDANSISTRLSGLELNPAGDSVVATVSFGFADLTSVATLSTDAIDISEVNIPVTTTLIQSSDISFANYPVSVLSSPGTPAQLIYSSGIILGNDPALTGTGYPEHTISLPNDTLEIFGSDSQVSFSNNQLNIDEDLQIGSILLNNSGAIRNVSSSSASPLYIGTNTGQITNFLPDSGDDLLLSSLFQLEVGAFNITNRLIELDAIRGVAQNMEIESPIYFSNNVDGHLRSIKSLSVGDISIQTNTIESDGDLVFDIASSGNANLSDEKKAIFAGSSSSNTNRVTNVATPRNFDATDIPLDATTSEGMLRLKELNDVFNKPINHVPLPLASANCPTGFVCSQPMNMGTFDFTNVGTAQSDTDLAILKDIEDGFISTSDEDNGWIVLQPDAYVMYRDPANDNDVKDERYFNRDLIDHPIGNRKNFGDTYEGAAIAGGCVADSCRVGANNALQYVDSDNYIKINKEGIYIIIADMVATVNANLVGTSGDRRTPRVNAPHWCLFFAMEILDENDNDKFSDVVLGCTGYLGFNEQNLGAIQPDGRIRSAQSTVGGFRYAGFLEENDEIRIGFDGGMIGDQRVENSRENSATNYRATNMHTFFRQFDTAPNDGNNAIRPAEGTSISIFCINC